MKRIALSITVLLVFFSLFLTPTQTTQAGSPVIGFDPGANDVVWDAIAQPDGKILAVGWFTSLGGQTRNHIGRLNIDGSLDTTFNIGTDTTGTLHLALQPDGKILVGGSFNLLDGQPHKNIGRINPDGTLDTTFDAGEMSYPAATNSSILAMIVQPDGKIIVVGGFTTLGGQPRNNIARLNPNGSLDTTFDPGVNGYVEVLALQPDGKILVGGDFEALGGVARHNIGRLNSDGSLDPSFDPAPDSSISGWVTEIAVQADGKIVVGGNFYSLGGQVRYGIGRMNPDGSMDATYTPGTVWNYFINDLVMQPDGKVVIAGNLTLPDGKTRYTIGRLNMDGSVDSSFTRGTANQVEALALQPDGKIIVGGYFKFLNNQAARNIGRLNADGSFDATFDQGAYDPGSNGSIDALALQADAKILVGGSFTTLGGQDRNFIARMNQDGTPDAAFNPGANGAVWAVTVQPDDKIVMGGSFTILGNQPRNNIGRLNADGSLDDSFDPQANGAVTALAIQPDNKILVGGSFTTLGGAAREHIGRLNADGSLDTAFNPGASGAINVMAIQPDGAILVGGAFTTLGGQTRSNIGRLSANGSLDTSFTPVVSGEVHTLAMQADNKILVGGSFTTLGGQARNNIGRLNADGSLDTAFNPGANGLVETLAVQADGKIIAGGAFTLLAGSTCGYIGRLKADGSLDSSLYPGANAEVKALAIQVNADILVAGDFTTLTGQTRSHIGRMYMDDIPLRVLKVDPGGTTITWSRGGSGPEFNRVTFEVSTDGSTYSLLGAGTRISGGWQFSSPDLPRYQNITIRARGYYSTGQNNSSTSVIESKLTAFLEIIQNGPIYTVNITDGDDDGLCSITDCTISEAINAANANKDVTTIDKIYFNITTGCSVTTGVCTIVPSKQLPKITDPVIIDGYTQPGASPNTLRSGSNARLLIELDGEKAVSANGLDISYTNATVRGLIINRFNGIGIAFSDPYGSATQTIIQGNYIGTDATGSLGLGNSSYGVSIYNTPSSVIIGGTNPAERNVISGNGNYGIQVNSKETIVQGNYIGTDATGMALLGNAKGGIFIDNSSYNSLTIGGTAVGAGNLIAGNGGNGITIKSNIGRLVQGNAIFDNAGLGIDLNNDGVTQNDLGDNDMGANDSQNFPVLTSLSGGILAGTLNSGVNLTYRVEFFASSTCDPSGYGEGEQFIGALENVTTGNNGRADFTFPYTPVVGRPFITATATYLTTLSTSEFSACLPTSLIATTTTLAVSPVSPVTYGQSVTLTATVSRTLGGAAPSGQVQFKDGETLLGSPVNLDADGMASLTSSTFIPGTHNLVAQYLLNESYYGSSGSTTLTVTPKNLTVIGMSALNKEYDGVLYARLSGSSGALVGVTNGDNVYLDQSDASAWFADANVGTAKPVTVDKLRLSGLRASCYTLTVPTLTASITPRMLTITAENKTKVYGDALPALTVQYSEFAYYQTPAVLTRPPQLTTDATATSPAGTYKISIVPGSPAALNYIFDLVDGQLTVTKASTSIELSTSSSSVPYGHPITFTATVSVRPPGAGVPSGTMTFKDGNATLGTAELIQAGANSARATFTTASLAEGTHTITPIYAGDRNFNNVMTSTSVMITPRLATADLMLGIQASANPLSAGSPLILSFSITNQGAAPATSTVLQASLPSGLEFQSATTSSGAECSRSGLTLTCQLGDLAISASQTITVQLNTPREASGAYLISASLTSPNLATGADPRADINVTVEPRSFIFLPMLAK